MNADPRSLRTHSENVLPGSATLAPHIVDIQEVLDKFALQQLAWTYCHAIDRCDFQLVRSLYHDDAIDDHGPMFCGSPDAYVAWLPSMMAHWEVSSHTISNMLFLVHGDHAEGELAVQVYHRTPGPQAREVFIRGRYTDQYAKRDGVWRYLRRALVLDSFEEKVVPDSAPSMIGDGIARGRPDATDACFSRLPMFGQLRGATQLHSP